MFFRMDDDRILKKLLYGELKANNIMVDRRRGTGTSWKATCQIHPNKWEEITSDHSLWRHETRIGVTQFETDCLQEHKTKREVRNLVLFYHLLIVYYHAILF